MGVEIADQGSGYGVVRFVSYDVVEVVASRGAGMVDVDEAQGDRRLMLHQGNKTIY